MSVKTYPTTVNAFTSVNTYSPSETFTSIKTFGNVSVYGADALAFITAAGITDPKQRYAINQLVTNLKNNGLWTKMLVIYPFVGGTAASHKWNLKEPLDTDAAFRIVFNGGWTHSANGVLPNGTNGWASTFFIPGDELSSQDSGGMSFYSRLDISGSTGFDAGAESSGNLAKSAIVARYSGDIYFGGWNLNGYKSVANTDSRGMYIINRVNSVTQQGWKDKIKVIDESSASVGATDVEITLGALNIGGTAALFSNKQCAFFSIEEGFTDADAVNLTTAVNVYQTTLGRAA